MSSARRDRLTLTLVFALALVLRLLHLYGQAKHNPFFYEPVMDEQMHHEWAKLIASGAGSGDKPYFRAPLYYWLLGQLYGVVGPSLAIARTLGAILGAGTCVLVALLARELGDRRAGVFAGVLAAVYWPFIVFDGELLTAGLEIFLGALTLLLLVRAARSSSKWPWLCAGLAWGLGADARPTVLAVAPAIALWIWMITPATTRPRSALRPAGLVLLGAALAIAPVTLRNRAVGGEWALIATNGGVNLYIGNNPAADGLAALVPGTRMDWIGGYEDTHTLAVSALGRHLGEVEVSDYWRDRALAWMTSNPGACLRLTAHKARLFFSPIENPNNQDTRYFASLSGSSVVYWVGFPVVFCGAVAALWVLRRKWRAWLLPVAFFVTYAAAVIIFFCPDRYRLPAVLPLIVLAGVGASGAIDAFRKGDRGAFVGAGIAAACAAVFVASNPPDRALARRDHDGSAHQSLARYYMRHEQWEPAAEHAREAAALRPYDPTACLTLAAALVNLHRDAEADEQFRRAVDAAPDYVDARKAYADFLARSGRVGDAIPQIEHVLAVDPGRVDIRLGLARALLAAQRAPDALAQLRIVVAADPGDEPARALLVIVVDQIEPASRAVPELRALHQADPKDVLVEDELAWLLATAEDGALRSAAEALRLGRDVQRLAGRPWSRFLSTLGAADAEVGDFDGAVLCETQALQLVPAAGAVPARRDGEARLALYQNRQPVRRAVP